MSPRLDIDADLVIHSEHDRIDIWREDDRLIVSLPSFRAARRLWSTTDALPVDVESLLSTVGPPIDIQIRRATVATIEDGDIGFVSRITGIDAPVAVRLRGAVAAVVRALG
ncbi:MAG: hypothetical protein PPP58_10445 [Natronomonas sp.]